MKESSKTIIGIIIFIILLIASFVIFKYGISESKPQKICCNNNCFNIEIADNDTSRQLGLMYRESLGLDEGMLFVYTKPGLYSFWMKNTLIPIAGIRLDPNLNIVDIIQMDPCKTEECPLYRPQSEAQYVLEINQSLISEKGLIHTGDKCELFYSKQDFKQRELYRKIKGNWNVLKSKF